MSLSLPSHAKIQISPTGLDVLAPLTFEEWSQVASSLGNAARGIAFVIGDWLVYGEANFRKGPAASRVATDAYDAAIQTTDATHMNDTRAPSDSLRCAKR